MTTHLTQRFRIIHPFHPLHSQEFEVLIYQRRKAINIVVFHDHNGRKTSIPAAWTDLPGEEDAYAHISAGRSYFRGEDLMRLCDLIERHQGEAD